MCSISFNLRALWSTIVIVILQMRKSDIRQMKCLTQVLRLTQKGPLKAHILSCKSVIRTLPFNLFIQISFCFQIPVHCQMPSYYLPLLFPSVFHCLPLHRWYHLPFIYLFIRSFVYLTQVKNTSRLLFFRVFFPTTESHSAGTAMVAMTMGYVFAREVISCLITTMTLW